MTRVRYKRQLSTCVGNCTHANALKADEVQVNSRLPSVPPARDAWFLTNGVIVSGPTQFDNVARSVAEGRVSRTVFVRHSSWKIWQRYEDMESLDTLALGRLVERLGRASANIGAQPGPHDVDITPLPPPEELTSSLQSQRVARSSIRPVSVDPVGVLGQASSLEEALLLTLSTAVAAASAHVGLLHRYQGDSRTAVTACAQGTGLERMLGCRLLTTDPSLVAAISGNIVIGEPVLGEVGRHIAARFVLAGTSPVGVAMVPVRLFDRLLGVIELGQVTRNFTAKEISRVEDVADVLAERVVVNGWFVLPD